MPNKRGFDLIILTVLLVHPAFGLLRMAARRWSAEGTGALSTVGDAIAASQGR